MNWLTMVGEGNKEWKTRLREIEKREQYVY